MNIYEKAVEGLALEGHDACVVQQSATDIGVWVSVWSHDLQVAREFRIHDEEVNYWSNHYDEMMQRRQPTKLVN